MIDELDAALSRPDLPAATADKLAHLKKVLAADPQARLASFSLATGEPHAVMTFGDVDTADLVVYLLHGIDTNLSRFPAWADTAQRVCADVIRACVLRGEPRRIATIAWFAWDSGDHISARATRHATIGAARLAVDIEHLVQRNPGAHVAVVTYSYSSTLLGEMFAMNIAEDVRTAFSIASAGMTHPAADAVADAIAAGDVVVYATEGAGDSIAPLGRLGQHPVDPRGIAGVITYECDGGEAPGPDGSTVIGISVDGHASQSSIDERGVKHTGYFDPRAQGYLTLVARLADAATRGG
ncbi:alpha/beta hydrolase [Microbacterium sp. NPDC089318]